MAKIKKSRGSTQKSSMRSDNLKARRIIRGEIRSYFDPKEYTGARSSLDAMKQDAEAASVGIHAFDSNYAKGANLVQVGGLAIYYDDQRKMLRKIYGNKVDDWSGDKVHNTYKNLIGREYSKMLNEREKAKAIKKEERVKKKTAKAAKCQRSKLNTGDRMHINQRPKSVDKTDKFKGADDIYTTNRSIAVVKVSSDRRGRATTTVTYYPKTKENIKAANSIWGRVFPKK